MTETAPRRALLWLVAISFFMQTLDSTIVNTALPAMAHDLGESPLRMQSVIISYSLVMAMLIPISGWITDRFGTRKTFFTAIFVFTLGSLFCALSTTLNQLVLARVVQGAGGALLLPVGRLAVLQAVPRHEFLAAMSFVTIPGLVGPLIGPTLGGWLVEYSSWHWIFFINIPIGFVGCLASLRFMPDFRSAARPLLDLSGFLLLAFSMAAISIALEGMAELGLRGAYGVVILIFGLASLAAYWLHALKHPAPLFPLQLFSTDSYRIGLIGNLFARIGTGAMPFLVPLMLQVGLQLTPSEAGMMMIPIALAGMLVKKLGMPLIVRFGYRRILIVNTFVVGGLMASFALFGGHHPQWLRYLQLSIFGAANSLQFTAMNTISLKDLDRQMASSGNSLLSMVQMLSMSLGVAGAGGLLAAISRQLGADTPADVMRAFQYTFICVGLVTAASACIFWQLEPDSKGELKPGEEPELEMG
ncbi:MAG TPA: multidrug transporter subunit MdtD [Oligoflexus sp.]|uniref:multidrug transporter subunit MdtD n=1 Tax=Oligoflexus sp. TaxID=1971216 RepID=UPI002D7EB760|nr:multidrug transporter subunit MdtD [Oligoflexus sp.]HET9239367.1 multidrug transporter subunit MdtD [Oligoflexus sp.]